jgi:glucose-6-phosphate dehydrogenase assembly protein OpcA
MKEASVQSKATKEENLVHYGRQSTLDAMREESRNTESDCLAFEKCITIRRVYGTD